MLSSCYNKCGQISQFLARMYSACINWVYRGLRWQISRYFFQLLILEWQCTSLLLCCWCVNGSAVVGFGGGVGAALSRTYTLHSRTDYHCLYLVSCCFTDTFQKYLFIYCTYIQIKWCHQLVTQEKTLFKKLVTRINWSCS